MANAFLGGESGEHSNHDRRETRWLTPTYITDALGPFDLDPCGAPDHHLAKITYTPEAGLDGLDLNWFGRVWLNPPYGRQAEPFMHRMVEHGHGVALIFARTETKLFHETVWDAASSVLFLKGRLNFLRSDKSRAAANSGAPSCLVAYSDDDSWYLEHGGLPGKHVIL